MSFPTPVPAATLLRLSICGCAGAGFVGAGLVMGIAWTPAPLF